MCWCLFLILFVCFIVVENRVVKKIEFPSAKEGSLTPTDGIGQILLPRTELIEKAYESVCVDIGIRRENPQVWFNTSHYWRSVKGSGKSVFLNLLGKKFQQNGYDVFHVSNTGEFDNNCVDFLKSIVESRTVGDLPLVLLLDEAQNGANLPIWNHLFREIKPMVVLAVGVPNINFLSANFEEKHKAGDMFIKPGNALDEVVDAFCEHYGDSSPKHDDVKKLCEFVCKMTGGHIFPLLKFCEHVIRSFSEVEDPPNFEDFFFQRLTSSSLTQTFVYGIINNRCFAVCDLPKFDNSGVFLQRFLPPMML